MKEEEEEKGRTFKLCVLTRWDFDFCVHRGAQRTKINIKINIVSFIYISVKCFLYVNTRTRHWTQGCESDETTVLLRRFAV